MRRLTLWLCMGLTLLSAPAYANYVREYSEAEKQAASDLIIIGTVTGFHEGTEPSKLTAGGLTFDLTVHYAEVSIKTNVKGASAKTINVVADSGISEIALRNLKIGEIYRFYLTSLKDGSYMSVNGSFGVLPVTPPIQ